MVYLWIFIGAYAVIGVLLVLWNRTQNSIAADRLRQFGANDKQISNFHQQTASASLLVRPTIFFGTIVGAVVSLVYWMFFA